MTLFVTPSNMTITFASVVIAILVGGVEALGLIGEQFKFEGKVWDIIGSLNANMNSLGFVIIGIFVMSWLGSMMIYRLNNYDEIEVKS